MNYKHQISRISFTFIGLLVVLVFLIGCNANAITPFSETGTIRIIFPDNSSKSLLNSEAASIASAYGVAIWDSSGNLITINSLKHNNDVPEVSVKEGTYKVLGVASYSPNEYSASIVGAGYSADVVVESNKTTEVSITLSAPNVIIDAPETAYESETIDVTYYASFGELPIRTHGGCYYLRNADGTTYRYNGKVSNSETTSVLMPSFEGEYYFVPTFEDLQIVDEWFVGGYSYLSFEGQYWNINKVSDGFVEYNEMFNQKITVIQRPTLMSFSFCWADD